MTAQPLESTNWWEDEHFQDRLTALLITDHETLKKCGVVLEADDFRPNKGSRNGRLRWVVAERALEHFHKHHEPIGRLVRADVLQYVQRLNWSSTLVNELREYLKLLEKIKPTAAASISEKVLAYKTHRLLDDAVEEVTGLQAAGQLTPEKWQEISTRILSTNGNRTETISYMETVDDRIERRKNELKRARAPYSLIDPLDSMIRLVGPKQMGLVLAPYKRGKSQFLLWLAYAYAIQQLNVLFITLEDTRDLVEDRLDAITTGVPIKGLTDKPITLRKQFSRFKSFVRSKIEIYDGTEGGVTVPWIERVMHSKREQGFFPDATIIDYDDEIVPTRRYKEKRFESDETYRLIRQYGARNNQIVWTAAQTQADTRGLKILAGDKLAEDKGKVRKVTVALGLGKGDWTPDSIYIHVAAHKCDRMDIGCEIVPDMNRMMIYDQEATRRAMKENSLDEEA